MRIRLAAAVLALPLLAFDCGGTQNDPSPFGTCTLQIRGAANEDLWCIVSAYDYSAMNPPSPEWVFSLAAYRGTTELGGGAGFFHTGPPALGTAYGWDATTPTPTSNVDSGGATRYASGGMTRTHEATSPLQGIGGTGALSITFTRIPPPTATSAQLMDVHGTLTGTLPATDGSSPPVTFTATF